MYPINMDKAATTSNLLLGLDCGIAIKDAEDADDNAMTILRERGRERETRERGRERERGRKEGTKSLSTLKTSKNEPESRMKF